MGFGSTAAEGTESLAKTLWPCRRSKLVQVGFTWFDVNYFQIILSQVPTETVCAAASGKPSTRAPPQGVKLNSSTTLVPRRQAPGYLSAYERP